MSYRRGYTGSGPGRAVGGTGRTVTGTGSGVTGKRGGVAGTGSDFTGAGSGITGTGSGFTGNDSGVTGTGSGFNGTGSGFGGAGSGTVTDRRTSRGWMSTDREIYEQIDDWSATTLKIRDQFKYNVRNNPYIMDDKDATAKAMMNYNEMLYAYCSQVRSHYGAGSQEHQHIILHYEQQLEEMRRRYQDEKKAKEDALTRVSEMASNMLTSGNANIVDISDPHRPMKLAEEFITVYDDEWTDAFEFLTDHKEMKDEDAIDLLFKILTICHDVSLDLSKKQHSNILQACSGGDPPPADSKTPTPKPTKQTTTESSKKTSSSKTGISFFGSKSKQQSSPKDISKDSDEIAEEGLGPEQSKLDIAVSEFRRSVAGENVDAVINAVGQELSKQNIAADITSNPDITKYYRKCAKLCWLMHLQFPAMHVRIDVKPGSNFNSDMHKEYRQRGSKIARMVWPALSLHKGGPLVSKGIADGDGSK